LIFFDRFNCFLTVGGAWAVQVKMLSINLILLFALGLLTVTTITTTTPGTADTTASLFISLAGPGHVRVSSAVYRCADARLLFVTDGARMFLPRPRPLVNAVFVALLLVLGGVELNPGPAAPLALGVINARSAVQKAALLHDVITDHRLDLLVVTETWMRSTHPEAITKGVAPQGYDVIHSFRDSGDRGGGVALIYSDELQASKLTMSTVASSFEHLVAKVTMRHGRVNLAGIYRPPSTSSCGAPVGQFCTELGDFLDELLALPGQPLICGDFNCPGGGAHGVDAHLLATLASHNMTQRVVGPTHDDGNTLDLLASLDSSALVSSVDAVRAGVSDHFLLVTTVNELRPRPDLLTFSCRNIRGIRPHAFAAHIRRSDAHTDPANDVDAFADQLERAVTSALDDLAPLKTRTKRRGKRNSRWLSDAARAAKRKRRRLERRWLSNARNEDVRVAYRAACRAANVEINMSRATFYKERLSATAGDQRAGWRVVKELLHSDDRRPVSDPQEAARLCDVFGRFFADKLQRIRDTIVTRLPTSPPWHRVPSPRLDPPELSALPDVTVDDVTRVIGSLPSKSSAMDYLPTSLLRSSVDVMAPLIARLVNLSFRSGVFPTSLKTGRVSPLLKKPGLDESDPANYRPITNLSTLSKVIEKLALTRLRAHIALTGNFSAFQSAYRAGHSTETALLRVMNDIVRATDDQQTTVLLALDISAAFDTVDFDTLCTRADGDFGIRGVALRWLRSFLTDRSYYIGVGTVCSPLHGSVSGVPQGSVLGPLMFAIYISPVGNVVEGHSLRYHQYADDTQLYMALRRGTTDFGDLSECVDDVTRWFLENGMLLNPTKTEAVLFGTRPQRAKVDTSAGIRVAGTTVPFSESVKLLGVTLDSDLTFDKHVADVVRGCNHHIRALRHIRPLLTDDVAKMAGHSIVGSRLDYCNSLLNGTTGRNIDRLQKVQNSLARVVCRAPWAASATELRRSLHWLPVRQRIEYKTALITYKTRLTGTPAYLDSLLEPYQSFRTLRSSDRLLLHQPFTKLTFAKKAFSVSAPVIWNSLNFHCKSLDSVAKFKRQLKSDLFNIAYGHS
jgi:hypothetical protein